MSNHPRPPPEAPGDGCFIATAAYGSQISPHVSFLRHIRDNILRKTRFGMKFVDAYEWIYYKFSPNIANIMNQSTYFKKFMRYFVVNPIVWFLIGVFKSLYLMKKRALKK